VPEERIRALRTKALSSLAGPLAYTRRGAALLPRYILEAD